METPQAGFQEWRIEAASRPPSAFLSEALERFDAFDLTNSEAVQVMLIDALLVETVPTYPNLRVWKAAPLESNTPAGVADYLIAPQRAYLETPLLCAVEAKRDDFEQGRAQCVATLGACRWNNQQTTNGQAGHDTDVYGIVSNGQSWQFFRLSPSGAVTQPQTYTTGFLPELLGALDHVCAACAQNAS